MFRREKASLYSDQSKDTQSGKDLNRSIFE
ncbi:Uncharacterised protein [Vibrio cholerae]|nr:Uncharacterised protein [Vibrio cholerae]